jgi:hypothetical protein
MKLPIKIITCCLVLLSINVAIQAQGWRGIVPLHSTRADVERLFGAPNSQDGFYEFKSESVEFFYSKGPCVNGWNIPRDTVINIRVIPKRDLRLSQIKIDIRGFKKTKDGELPGIYYYTSEEKGITIKTSAGLVVDVTYSWTNKDRNLLCHK